MNEYFELAKSWMENNEKLAGWAQATGGLIGIAIAISVPAYQRGRQLKDAQTADFRSELNSTILLAHLIGEIYNSTNTLFKNPDIIQEAIVSERAVINGLQQRIDNLEHRLFNAEHLEVIFSSRITLLHLQRISTLTTEDIPLIKTSQAIGILKTEHERLKHEVKVFSRKAEQMKCQYIWIKTSFFRKPLLWWKHRLFRKAWKIEIPAPAKPPEATL